MTHPDMSPMSDEAIADVLADTREYIEEHDWIQEEFFGPDGQVCTVGGMLGSQGFTAGDVYVRPVLYASRALSDSLGIGDHSSKCPGLGPCSCPINWVTTWNDEGGRTKQEVLDALAKAEKTLRAGFDPDA